MKEVPMRLRNWIFLLVLICPALGRADYVVLSTDAPVYEFPRSHSRVLAQGRQGNTYELVSRRSQNGYYEIRFGEDETKGLGYIYRTHFRAFTGDPALIGAGGSSASSTTAPSVNGTVVSVASPTPQPAPAEESVTETGVGIDPDGSFNGCPLQGTAKSAGIQQLDRSKNRYAFPAPSDFDPSISLQAMLAPGTDQNRFQVGQAADITGYVYDVKPGGTESCNCGAVEEVNRDTHIELTLGPNDSGPTRRVIVEITPRLRAIMQARGVDWTTPTMMTQLVNHWIRVKGWVLFDIAHIPQAYNTNPANPSDWRATCWEIHPVTDLQIVNQP